MKIEKGSKNISYISRKLGFSISILPNWEVNTDKLEEEPIPNLEEAYKRYKMLLEKLGKDSIMSFEEFKRQATEPPKEKEVPTKEAYEKLLENVKSKAIEIKEFKKIYKQDKKKAYRMFFEKLLGMPPDEMLEELSAKKISAEEAYTRLIADPEMFLVSFTEFKEQYEWEQEQRREEERRRDELAQMEEGYFEASPLDDKDYPSVEITKLKLTRSITPLELYKLDKPNPEVVPWGNHPSKGIKVDSLQGIKYYYIFDTGETRNMNDMPKFFNVYLIEDEIGWIISCSCIARAFPRYKEIFTHIIGSFHRI